MWDVGCAQAGFPLLGMPCWCQALSSLVPGSELAASPAWGAHGGTAGVGPPGAAELEPPGKVESWKILPFGVKAGAWRTGSRAAALGCIPDGGKYLTFPAEAAWPGPGCPEILSLCCGVGAHGVSSPGLGGERGVPAAGLGLLRWVRVRRRRSRSPGSALCAQVGSARREKGVDPRTGMLPVTGMLQVTGAVGHSCAAGRAGLSPSPSSSGIRWHRALVLEVFTHSM